MSINYVPDLMPTVQDTVENKRYDQNARPECQNATAVFPEDLRTVRTASFQSTDWFVLEGWVLFKHAFNDIYIISFLITYSLATLILPPVQVCKTLHTSPFILPTPLLPLKTTIKANPTILLFITFRLMLKIINSKYVKY